MTRLASGIGRKGNSDLARRAADYLHEGVDRVMDAGEFVEDHLKSGYRMLDTKARRLNGGVKDIVGTHPWAAIGGSVAIGLLIGMLGARRR